MRALLSLSLFVALTACGGAPDRPADAGSSAPPAASPTSPPAPAPAPVAPAPSAEPAGLAGFSGYGDLRLGAAEADMAHAWGGTLERLGASDGNGCYYLRPQRGSRTEDDPAFMVENGVFVRYDIEHGNQPAPGGGRIGMTKADIARLYPGQVEERPHQYTNGQYLRIRAPSGKGVLLFETDGKGDAAKVLRWRVGHAPQVDYVEGCS